MEGRCKDCRFWVRFNGPDGQPVDNADGMRECKGHLESEQMADSMMPLWEGSETIGTWPDFGCVLFEQWDGTDRDRPIDLAGLRAGIASGEIIFTPGVLGNFWAATGEPVENLADITSQLRSTPRDGE